jgi:hypothetical protein
MKKNEGNEKKKEEKEKAKVKKENLIQCRIWGNKDIRIYLWVSSEIEDLFKYREDSIQTSDCYKGPSGGHKFYPTQPQLKEFASSMYCNIDAYGRALNGGGYNFSILRTKGLKNGQRFYLHDGLYSREYLQKWAENLKILVVKLYKSYVRPIDLEVTIAKKELW